MKCQIGQLEVDAAGAKIEGVKKKIKSHGGVAPGRVRGKRHVLGSEQVLRIATLGYIVASKKVLANVKRSPYRPLHDRLTAIYAALMTKDPRKQLAKPGASKLAGRGPGAEWADVEEVLEAMTSVLAAFFEQAPEIFAKASVKITDTTKPQAPTAFRNFKVGGAAQLMAATLDMESAAHRGGKKAAEAAINKSVEKVREQLSGEEGDSSTA